MEGCLEKLHIFLCASLPFDYLQRPIIPSKKNLFVALCHPDTNYSDQGPFKPVLINTAMPDLAYNQNENIYNALQGSIDATFLPSKVESTSENIGKNIR